MNIRILIFIPCFFLITMLGVHAQTRPDNIPGLHLWLRADSGTVVNAGKISEWEDVSAKTFNAQQVTSANQPSYITNALNSMPAISFNGSSHYMLLPQNLLNDVASFSMFYVLNVKDMNRNGGIFGSNAGYFCFELATISNKGSLRIRQNDGNNPIITDAILFSPIDSWNMLSIVASNNNGKVWKNGITLSTTASNAKLPILPDVQQALGRYASDYGDFYGIFDIAEFIIFDRSLSPIERQEIENYLRLKYFPSEYRPPVDLGADITEQYSLAPITITVPPQPYYVSYEWNTGETTPSIDVSNSGSYWVTVYDDWGYVYTDTINIIKPEITHSADTTLCAGDTFIWDCGLAGAYTYTWSTGASSQSIAINSAGDYWVQVEDSFSNILYSDTITVAISTFPQEASLGPDAALCQGNILELITRKADANSYLWNDGSTNPEFVVQSEGTYSAIITDFFGCTLYDTIAVTIKGVAPEVHIAVEDICFGQSTRLQNTTIPTDGTSVQATQWIFGTDTLSGEIAYRTFPNPETNSVRIIVETDAGCFGSLDTSIYIGHIPVSKFSPPRACTYNDIEFINTGTIGSGFIQNSSWFIEGEFYSGNSLDYSFDSIGTYPVYLQSVSDLGCTHDTTINIDVRESAELQFVYNKTCQNEKVFFFDKTDYKPENSPVDGNWYVNDIAFPQYSVFGTTFAQAGDYIITLEVTTMNGCKNSVSDTITIYEAPIFDSLKIYGCNSQEITMREYTETFGQSVVSYRWDIDSIGIRVDKEPVVMFKNTGEYPFTLEIITEHECIGTAQGKIFVQEPPIADFSFYPEFGATPLDVDFYNSSQGAVQYEWRFEENATSTEMNPHYEFTLLDTSYAHLRVYSSYNCVDSISKHIPIDLADHKIEILSLSYFITDRGFLQYNVQVANIGNAPIYMIEFLLDNPDFPIIAETWKGYLDVGNSLNYSFVGTTKMIQDKTPPYLCIIGNIISQDIYKVYFSDSLCVDFKNKFSLFSIAPSPADEFITITLSTPNEGDFSIECYDVQGKLCSKETFTNVSAGLQQITIDTHSFRVGTYTIRAQKGAQKIDKQFVIGR